MGELVASETALCYWTMNLVEWVLCRCNDLYSYVADYHDLVR
jgi:hypothetical protein